MRLPELPKKRAHKEADITPLVFDWFEKNWKNSAAIEIKVGKNKLKPHQEIALRMVAKSTFSYKIPDMGRVICFDGFLLKNADSFIVTCNDGICEGLNLTNNEKIVFKIKNR